MTRLQQDFNFLRDKKIKPIIKWTGGKYKEFEKFSAYLPQFDRYFEPFFGGGGVFFALQPTGDVFLNDKSEDLATFYSLLNSSDFNEELMNYALAWDEAGLLFQRLKHDLLNLYKQFLFAGLAEEILSESIKALVSKQTSNVLFSERFIVYPDRFFKEFTTSVFDKCKRLRQIAHKEARYFSDNELDEHFETSIKGGLYLFLRRLTNLQFTGSLQMTKEKATANWYFVREFCYASMFRYNRNGEFNIPYGGIAYNKKNFRQKVTNIFSQPVQELFKKATFHNLDFQSFLEKTSPRENDFIFLDPPYDSEFSEYDQNSFGKEDQLRLRNVLFSTPAKWMLVIKETDYIRSLYTSEKCSFIEFDKTYTYNVRGRNNRETKHLIIVNYAVDSKTSA